MNQLLTHESKSIDTAMQSLKKANNWLSSFIESYSPPLEDTEKDAYFWKNE